MSKRIFVTLVLAVSVLFFAGGVLAAPFGASVTPGASSNGNSTNPTSHGAIAGNVTELTIDGNTITQAWQGYYGNVSGAIVLNDGSSNVFYNWTSLSADGEVYASTNNSITWGSVRCFNFSSLEYTNVTGLENAYNIAAGDADGVDETFNRNNHPQFYIGNTQFASGACNNTMILGNGGTPTFYEALMIDQSKNATVFASIIADNTNGFDGRPHDFEMLVLDDGHGTNTATTTYYFYVELNA